MLDERLRGIPRLTAKNAAHPEGIRAQVKSRRSLIRWIMLTPVGLVLFAVAMSFIDDYAARPTAPESSPEPAAAASPREVTAAVGETVMLADGARVTVETVDQSAVDIGTEYAVAVQYCAADADSVDPEEFRLMFGDPVRLANRGDAPDPALAVTELEAGKCASGNLGFLIPGDVPSQVFLDFSSPQGDRVTWTVDSK